MKENYQQGIWFLVKNAVTRQDTADFRTNYACSTLDGAKKHRI